LAPEAVAFDIKAAGLLSPDLVTKRDKHTSGHHTDAPLEMRHFYRGLTRILGGKRLHQFGKLALRPWSRPEVCYEINSSLGLPILRLPAFLLPGTGHFGWPIAVLRPVWNKPLAAGSGQEGIL
jgi:hypothetical protein